MNFGIIHGNTEIIRSNIDQTFIRNSLHMNNKKIIYVEDPIDSQDAATKIYVDSNTWSQLMEII